MCGRFALYSSPEKIASYFSATLRYQFSPSYNIAPTVAIPVLVNIESERFIVPMRWGFIPTWHQEGKKLSLLNNAKIETIDTKPSFRTSFKRQRCIIIANGFYEWDASTKPKQPYYFHLHDDAPIAMAGIWSRWVEGEQEVDSCCIITTAANSLVGKIHDRMPALLDRHEFDQWLDPGIQDPNIIKQMPAKLSAYQHLKGYPVTAKVNKSAYDNKHCIDKITL